MIFILILVYLSHCLALNIPTRETPNLILISFDGFRWDYLNNYTLPNIQTYFVQKGVHAIRGLKNSFTTVTFPNHWSMATGLNPESHGIVGNIMYDSDLKQVFNDFNTLDNNSIWYGQNKETIPIWILNQMKDSRRSGIMGAFPGSLSCFHNQSVYLQADYSYPDELNWYNKVDTLVEWFLSENINFGVLYFPEPDDTGHIFGPYNQLEMSRILAKCDDVIGYLIQKLIDVGLFDQMNMIITSDHGMESVSENHAVYLNQYVNVSLFKSYGGLSYRNIFPNNPNETDALYTSLKKIPNVNVFKREEVPKRLDYSHNVRVGPIVMYGSDGYEIFTSNTSFNWNTWNGDHGYDNTYESMHPIFVARGPAFKENYTSKQFNLTDVYILMCTILELEPAPNNGSYDNIKDLLKENTLSVWSIEVFLLIKTRCGQIQQDYFKSILLCSNFVLLFALVLKVVHSVLFE